MNKISTILLLGIVFSPAAWPITPQDRHRLDQFAQQVIVKSKSVAGYPVNQDTSLDGFYAWYVKNKLYRASMNNVGNPRNASPYSINTHQFENEVVDYFAKLYGFQGDGYWGFVSASGTDGNNHGIYFGRKFLQAKSSVAPIIYVSEEAHYSIKKLADVQNLELRLIKATDMGQMDLLDFDRQLDPTRPALVVIAMGTTFKGAIDDQAAIHKILAEKHHGPEYIHLDAALFGGYLPYAGGEGAELVSQQLQKFDSIAVSGHKFFGFDEPMGIFITTKEVFGNLNPFHVTYLNDAVPTITCSRSALDPLKFWWKLHSTKMEKFQAASKTILSDAEYLFEKLQDAGIKVWKNPYSNTIFFERPSVVILSKYDLASDESPVFGKLAHFIVMPHVKRKLINGFVNEMKRWKAQEEIQYH
ncbi:MAG: aminotransferase class V-fold PLP-dependent enzyme [Proteobacteria bacterium]|nr:aminotransferase class V-fold PLP-dependent enzyme [Pseudomonadota bacterium]